MNGRRLIGAALALLVSVGIYVAWPKQRLSPEDEIRALVARAVASAEKRDASGVMEAVSERDFRGPGGAKSDEVRSLLVGQFFRAQGIAVANPSLEVSVGTPPTTGHFKGTFLFARDGAALEASRYELEADVVKTTDGWKITSASWSR